MFKGGPGAETSLESESEELEGHLGRVICVKMGTSWREDTWLHRGKVTHRETEQSQLHQPWKKIQAQKSSLRSASIPRCPMGAKDFMPQRGHQMGEDRNVPSASPASKSTCLSLAWLKTLNYVLVLCWCSVTHRMWHNYIHITAQTCTHKARHTELYGKCKSISEVIRTIWDFPLLASGRRCS